MCAIPHPKLQWYNTSIKCSDCVFESVTKRGNPCSGLFSLWLESNGPGPSATNHQLLKHNHCARPALHVRIKGAYSSQVVHAFALLPASLHSVLRSGTSEASIDYWAHGRNNR